MVWILNLIVAAAIFVAAAFACTDAARAEDVADFYRGKRIKIVVGYAPGSTGDAHARLVARNLGKLIPGRPTLIVQNMPGAGGLVAANFLYAAAPNDGTVIGSLARDLLMAGQTGLEGNVRFDLLKFTWIGSSSSFADDALLLIARTDAAVTSARELGRADGPSLIVGTSGELAAGSGVPIGLREPGGMNLNLVFGGATEELTGNGLLMLVRRALNLNLKTLRGFADANAIDLAIQQGEVHGRIAQLSALRVARPQWLGRSSGMRVLVQMGRSSRHPMFPDVPTARELAPNAQVRELIELAELPLELSRLYGAPPGVPAARAKALETAFTLMHEERDYLAGVSRLGIDISPIDEAAVVSRLRRLAEAPPALRQQLESLMANGRKDEMPQRLKASGPPD